MNGRPERRRQDREFALLDFKYNFGKFIFCQCLNILLKFRFKYKFKSFNLRRKENNTLVMHYTSVGLHNNMIFFSLKTSNPDNREGRVAEKRRFLYEKQERTVSRPISFGINRKYTSRTSQRMVAIVAYDYSVPRA